MVMDCCLANYCCCRTGIITACTIWLANLVSFSLPYNLKLSRTKIFVDFVVFEAPTKILSLKNLYKLANPTNFAVSIRPAAGCKYFLTIRPALLFCTPNRFISGQGRCPGRLCHVPNVRFRAGLVGFFMILNTIVIDLNK